MTEGYRKNTHFSANMWPYLRNGARQELLLMINRKSHMRFRLVPKSSTLDDLELLQVQFFSEFCATSHVWEATTVKRMKIDPYYQRQKCSPVTLVSGNIRRMRIFAGFLWVRASNDSEDVDDGNFWRFGWLLFRKR